MFQDHVPSGLIWWVDGLRFKILKNECFIIQFDFGKDSGKNDKDEGPFISIFYFFNISVMIIIIAVFMMCWQ